MIHRRFLVTVTIKLNFIFSDLKKWKIPSDDFLLAIFCHLIESSNQN